MRPPRLGLAAALSAVLVVLAGCGSSGGTAASSPPNRFTPAGSSAASPPAIPVTTSPARPTISEEPSGSDSPPAGPSRTPTHPVPSTPLKTLTIQGQHDTYKIEIWAQDVQTVCYRHAYGQQVIAFLTAHPCRGGVYRRLATTTVDGRAVGFDQSQLSFGGADPDAYQAASQFQTLVSEDGTGNIDDMLRDGYRLPSGPAQVPSPDTFKALSQDSAVTITDAWYLQGSTPRNDPGLTTMAEDLFLQF